MKTKMVKFSTFLFLLSSLFLIGCEQEEVIPEIPEGPPKVQNLLLSYEPVPESNHVELPADGELRLNYKIWDNSKIIRHELFAQINDGPKVSGYLMNPDQWIDTYDMSIGYSCPLSSLVIRYPDYQRVELKPGDQLNLRISLTDDIGQISHRFLSVFVK
jgi:hypothetical protein